MKPHDRERIQVEVTQRVTERYVSQAHKAPSGYLQTLVNDVVYHERRRLERAPRSSKTKEELAFYRAIQRRLKDDSETNMRALLEQIARRFVAEVVGNFNERVYKLSTTVLPTGLSLLLNAMSPSRLLDLRNVRRGLDEHIKVQGKVDEVRSLLDHGTLIVVPTHSSNLDSIIIGYAIYLMGLPPMLYGAGLNLFTNPLISFFMHNLGAYTVDRKKTAQLYKDVLKEYATVATEMGYHQLFFPGGTRSRSGAVEQHLKKGLLGTAVQAYVNNLQRGSAKPKLFVAPCTLSYKLVLEAETLIDDYLKEAGKSRYIIEDDEFSRPRRILNFMENAMSLDDEIFVTFSEPLDIFGNRVDRQGRSLDPRGRVVDPRSYVSRDGVPYHDQQRDMQYTNEVSDEVAQLYLQDNVLMTTNVVARALFDLLHKHNPGLDFYRLLHTGGRVSSLSMAELHEQVDRLLQRLRELEVAPRLSPQLEAGDVQEIVNDALTHFRIYHTTTAAERRGDRVFHLDRNLLLFYSNRLEGYDLQWN